IECPKAKVRKRIVDHRSVASACEPSARPTRYPSQAVERQARSQTTTRLERACEFRNAVRIPPSGAAPRPIAGEDVQPERSVSLQVADHGRSRQDALDQADRSQKQRDTAQLQ